MKELIRNFFKLKYKLNGCIWLNKIVTFKKILTLHSVKVCSSPNSPPLFVRVFWGETNRSSLSQKFFKIGVLKNFANFIGKHQCWSISWKPATLLKRDSNTMFSCEIWEIFKNNLFYRALPVTASEQTQEISVVHWVAKWCSGQLAQVYLCHQILC